FIDAAHSEFRAEYVRNRLDETRHESRMNVIAGVTRIIVDKNRQSYRPIGHFEVLNDLILGTVGVIVRTDVPNRFSADRFGVRAEIDGGERIDGADMDNAGNAMFKVIHHNFRGPFSLIGS